MNIIEFEQVSYATPLYDSIVDLREQVLRLPLGLKFSDKDLQIDKDEIIFALLLNHKAVACVQARSLDKHRVKLRQMAVHPDFQGLGLGKHLLIQAEQRLINKDFGIIELNARKTVVKFYQKSGFQIDSKEFLEIGIPHFKMVKKIGNQ